MEAQQTSVSSSVEEDDRSVLQSLRDDSTIDSDSEDVCNESYEVLLMILMIFSHYEQNDQVTSCTANLALCQIAGCFPGKLVA